jgi:hypothetical protein
VEKNEYSHEFRPSLRSGAKNCKQTYFDLFLQSQRFCKCVMNKKNTLTRGKIDSGKRIVVFFTNFLHFSFLDCFLLELTFFPRAEGEWGNRVNESRKQSRKEKWRIRVKNDVFPNLYAEKITYSEEKNLV